MHKIYTARRPYLEKCLGNHALLLHVVIWSPYFYFTFEMIRQNPVNPVLIPVLFDIETSEIYLLKEAYYRVMYR